MSPAPPSSDASPKLRVALLLDGPALKRYQAELVRQLKASSFATVELLIYPGRAAARPKRLLFDLFTRLDSRRLHAIDPLLAVNPKELREIPSIQLSQLDAAAADQLRPYGVDVILEFGHAAMGSALTAAARCGVWSLLFGDTPYTGADPAYFWEMVHRNPVSGVILTVSTNTAEPIRQLSSGFYTTIVGPSIIHNRRRPYWASVVLAVQKLRELHSRGWADLRKGISPLPPSTPTKPAVLPPTNFQFLRFLAPALRQKMESRFVPKTGHWRIAIRRGKLLDPAASSLDLSGFRLHESPAGHFYADPFLIHENGEDWLFFEDYVYATHRGHLGCAQVMADGSLGEARTILQRPYHLSYPCMIREGDELYMIPESSDNTTVEIYRCAEFPHRWDFVKVLLSLPAIDSTVFRKDDLYWMFTSVMEPFSRARQLVLYYSSSLLGEWLPHPANPISSDVRINRGAGAVFEHQGMWIRPSQDCSTAYGYSFTLHQITTLTPTAYAERALHTVLPNWAPGLIGTHTYARAGECEAIDGAIRVRRKVVAR